MFNEMAHGITNYQFAGCAHHGTAPKIAGISFGVSRLRGPVRQMPRAAHALQVRLKPDEADCSAWSIHFAINPVAGDMEVNCLEFPACLALAVGAAHLPMLKVYVRKN